MSTTTLPTPTTASKTVNGKKMTRTTWTVGDHTLTLIEREDNGAAYWHTATLHNDAPNVDEDTNSWYNDDAPATYAVNWSAWGDRTPEVAMEYAARIMAAANAARVFTAIRAEHK